MQVITTHKNSDFDALASLVAATLRYPNATAAMPRVVNPNVKAFLAIHKDLFNLKRCSDVDLDSVDSLVVVDTNSWSRLF